jgi:hypothetical protein
LDYDELLEQKRREEQRYRCGKEGTGIQVRKGRKRNTDEDRKDQGYR